MLFTLLFCIIAYLIGSISSAILVCRLAGLPDPRTTGSKNPGATNVMRIGGKKIAFLTLLGDVLKGVVPVMIAVAINPNPLFVAPVMVAVFLGHLYPIFFKFQGGKGVATAFGAMLGVSWLIGVLLLSTWLLIALIFRISSLAAIVTVILAPVYAFFLLDLLYVAPVAFMSIMILWRHKGNITRLLHGTET